ncbi:MAG: PHP domain-containing protein [Clostridia bacterium]|nr:PHP domain-containing protein [Clostridia bacterium]
MFTGDYHTHTKYSDGRGSVEENALAAKALRLREIAVTDHAFHVLSRDGEAYCRLKEDCAAASEKTGVRVIAGVEADIISLEGDLDLSESEMGGIDYLIAGFHKFAPPKSASDFFKMYLVTYFNGLIPTSRRARERNTLAVISAIERYPIKVLTHLGHSLKVDIGAVARACAKKGVLVEINAKHLRDFQGAWRELRESGARFIVNSDAHCPRDVGRLEKALRRALEEGISPENIVNYYGD